MHLAALRGDAKAARAAIEVGSDLDELDHLGNSALHWAVFGGHVDVAEVLLDAGADPNVMSGDGVTPCWRAVDFGLTEIETLIRAHGGKVATGPSFDRVSFSIFGNSIGQPIPEEDD